ncbi:POK18 protein, partial [Pachyramphus minor]|nr:POK18 protein [Pachyramphus minor]
SGRDPGRIVLPVQSWYFKWCMAHNYELQAATSDFQGQVSYHLPSHPLIKFFREVPIGQKNLSQSEPVKRLTVFTDGSGKTGKVAIVRHDEHGWHDKVVIQEGSPQVVELRAVTVVFQLFPQPVNIVTDSAYVANLLSRLDRTILASIDHRMLFTVLLELWTIIQQRTTPYFVLHVCSHTTLPGFFTEGNAKADALLSAIALGPTPYIRQQALLSHQFFHQGSTALQRQFGLTQT